MESEPRLDVRPQGGHQDEGDQEQSEHGPVHCYMTRVTDKASRPSRILT